MANAERNFRVRSVENPLTTGKRAAFLLIGTRSIPLEKAKSLYTASFQGGLRAFAAAQVINSVVQYAEDRPVFAATSLATALVSEAHAVSRARRLERAYLQAPNIERFDSDLPDDEVPDVERVRDVVQQIKQFIAPDTIRNYSSRISEDFEQNTFFQGSPRSSISASAMMSMWDLADQAASEYRFDLDERHQLADRAGAISGLDSLNFRGFESQRAALKNYILRSDDSGEVSIARHALITAGADGKAKIQGRWGVNTYRVVEGRLQKMEGFRGSEWVDLSAQDLAYIAQTLQYAIFHQRSSE